MKDQKDLRRGSDDRLDESRRPNAKALYLRATCLGLADSDEMTVIVTSVLSFLRVPE